MRQTLDYYDAECASVVETYESVDFRPIVTHLLEYAPDSGRLLDLGCGSGRDAAFYLAEGYDVTAVDGSLAMLREAARYHPELTDHLLHHELPGRLPFGDAGFDIVTSMAVIMHMAPAELPGLFRDMGRVIRRGGIVAYSVNTHRAGLDERGTDAKGRHFTCLPADEWEQLHREAGLRTRTSWENGDITGRPGIRWVTFVCEKE